MRKEFRLAKERARPELHAWDEEARGRRGARCSLLAIARRSSELAFVKRKLVKSQIQLSFDRQTVAITHAAL